MGTTPFDYHNNEGNHGNYQFTPLKELVNELLFEYSDSDHILKNTKRSRILHYVKDGIRKFNKQVFKDIRAIEITVPENLSIAMPHNFVDYVRISLVVEDPATNSFRLMPLDVNNNMNIADGYLQDHDAEILFDQQGGILMADASNVYNKPYKKYQFTSDPMGGYFEKDTSKLSKFGEFVVDERHGKIAFSSDLFDKEIVLEYLSDGLEFDTYGEEEIKVHKQLIPVVQEWVYYSCIKGKKNVSRSDKTAALNRFKAVKHQAKLERAKFNFLDIAKALRTSSKRL